MHSLVPAQVHRMVTRGQRYESTTGAALVIDAEGSTALSARLQPHGTAGAEAFASILSTTFRPMVERVIANGGTVAELAGDGILAVFPEEHGNAVTRAIDTAATVIDDLGSTTEFATPDGPASLTVRCAIGAGQIEWHLWSSDEAESPQNSAFACFGPAVEEARRGEAITPGGVISVGPTARPGVPADATSTELAEGFVTVSSEGTRTHAPSPRATPTNPEEQWRFYPPDIVESDLRDEFRDVVAVFVDFAELNPDGNSSAVGDVLNGLSRYRGYLSQVTRPGENAADVRSLVLWGAPTSREHDIGYALRFLDDLRARYGSGIRAAVTRSTAFTGFVGGPSQEVYTAIGPGVNLAARICDSAEWGEIRVDRNITSRLNDPWRLESLGELSYRGFANPIATSAVTYVPPVRIADPVEVSIIGRDHEIDLLEDLVAPMWTGRTAGVIAVVGEPGIGKSSLIASLEARLSTRTPAPVWIHAQADEIRTQPLATLRDAFSAYFGRPGLANSGERLDSYLGDLGKGAVDKIDELSRARGALGDLLQLAPDVERAEQLDPKTRFENLVMAVETLIATVELTAPVIVAIADGNWMDSGTADVLRRVVSGLDGRRLAIVVETREPETALEHGHVVEVGPLNECHIAELAQKLLDSPPSSGLVSALTERSAGNPFFARQLLLHLEAKGAESEPTELLASLADDVDVPLDMQRLLVTRLDELAVGVRRLVQTGSVLGRDVDLRLLEWMTSGQPDIDSKVEEAVSFGVWERVDTNHVAFTSSLLRDAAYGMLLHADARGLHREAAAAIEALSGDSERRDGELAYHHDRAGNSIIAADHYVAAGRLAAGRYDNAQAHAHLDRALQLIPVEDSERRFASLRLKHDVYEVMGERSSQEAMISSMEGLVPDEDPSRFIEVALLRGRLSIARGKYEDAGELVARVAPLAEGPALVAEKGSLTFLQADVARYLGRTSEAAALAEVAIDLFDRAGDELHVALASDFAGGIAWETGDFDTAVELHRAAAETFGETGHVIQELRALNNMATAIFSIGDYSRAREIHQEGVERSREVGYRMGEGDHLDNMGGTAWAVGDLDLAVRCYTEALHIRDAMDDAWGIAISKGNLGMTRRVMGSPQEALALYKEALEIDQRIGRRRGEAYDLHGIGLCHLDLGRHNLATESLRRAAQIREDLEARHLANESHIACAVAMLRSGDPEGAVELVDVVLADEGDDFFAGAVETTATRLRCVEVLEVLSPDRARAIRERTVAGVLARADRISDPEQRASYLEQVESHSWAVTDN